MKQFFSILFFFAMVSGFAFAQDAADIAPTQTGNIVPIQYGDPQYQAPAAILYDNGPLVNAPGGGFGGADASVLQSALSMNTYGFGHQISATNSVADDFTVTGAGWNIDQIQFFAYQTGSTTTSTINDIRVQIWNGDPTAGGTVIWGNMTTNRLATTTFSNIYRSIDTDPLANNRPIMVTTATIGTTLAPGTYWVQWMCGGTLTSGPWAPPITINGQTTTGNAKQNLGGTTWQNLLDTGTNTPQGLPFIVIGTQVGASYYFENFELFAFPGKVACYDPVNWTTWSNAPCTAEDADISTTYAKSGTKSFVVKSVHDLVKPLGDKTSGEWYMSWWMYIPTGKAGYFNTLNTFPASQSGHWGMEVYFGDQAAGQGRLLAFNPAQTNFTFAHNTWLFITVYVNLNTDQAQFWIGSAMIHQWQWTRGNPGTYALRLAANDFYGPLQSAVDECYYDDYWFAGYPVPVELTSFTANVNNLGQVVLNWETASELNNQGFEIERRSETSEFRTIGFVEGNGTTTLRNNYSFVDKFAENGINYYRLKQIDFSGTYAYSDVVEVEVNGPLTFNLEQNYPNPFNPSTSIKYSVPETGNIKLSVYNIVGEEIAVLAEGFTQAGFYEVTFDASNLPSGIYLYKLQSDNSVLMKKMVLLK